MKPPQLSALLVACCLWFSASSSRAQEPDASSGGPVGAADAGAADAAAQPDTTSGEPAAPAPIDEAAATDESASNATCSAAPDPDVPAAKKDCTAKQPPHVDQVPDVASLKTPESPAFMALGIAPSEIQRPSTPTGLATSLANGYTAGGSLALLQNFALEFSPFWLFPHRRLSHEQVISQPQLAVVRNLSISLATSPKEVERTRDDGSTEKINYGRFSFGARTTLWPGTPTKVARQCLSYIKHALDASADERNVAVRAFMTGWLAEPKNQEPKVEVPGRPSAELSVTDPERYDVLVVEWERKLVRAYAADAAYMAWARRKEEAHDEFWHNYLKDHPKDDPRFDRCMSDLHSREGFMAEAAGAYAFSVPRGDIHAFKQNALQSLTGWLTAGVILEDLFKREVEGSLLGVFRVQRTRGAVDDQGQQAMIYDFGARLATAITRFGLAVEGTRRWKRLDPTLSPKETQKLWRIGLSLDYRLAGGVWLTGTFGKDFGTKDATPLFALANFQWNFGLERGVKPDTKVTQ